MIFKKHHPKFYSIVLLLLTVVFFIVMGIFNWLIDPYGVMNSPALKGYNLNKPEAIKQTRKTKITYFAQYKPNALILGTSRIEHGISPYNHNFANYKPYNLGISGASLPEILFLYQYAIEHMSIKMLVLGLDLFNFNIYWRREVENDFNKYLKEDNLKYLISKDAFEASRITMKAQNQVQSVRYFKYGNIDNEQMILYLKSLGTLKKHFENTEKSFFCNDWKPKPERKFSLVDEMGNSTLEIFRNILRLSQKNNISLKIFLSPIHVRLLITMSYANMLPYFEKWKEELAKVLNEEEFKNSGFKIWDFTGVNDYTMEGIDQNSFTEEIKDPYFYVDPSHYSDKLGDLMLEDIFSPKKQSDRGEILELETIAQHNDSIRKKLTNLLKRNSALDNYFRIKYSNPEKFCGYEK